MLKPLSGAGNGAVDRRDDGQNKNDRNSTPCKNTDHRSIVFNHVSQREFLVIVGL